LSLFLILFGLFGMELAGISGAQLFPGSFSGWIAHGLPVETGPE
jgi:3-mercaptopyruvate sulfurtransferase SseA